MISSNYLSIGMCASMLGVCTKTLRRWDKKATLKPSFRTLGNHRRYERKRILKLMSKDKSAVNEPVRKRAVVYGRVSSSRQRNSGDLIKQLDTLMNYCRINNYRFIRAYSDVGSGLNDKRKGLLKLLKDVSVGKIDVVVVNYNDRLARFGLQIIKEYLVSWGAQLEVIHPTIIEQSSPHAELITDLTAILYSFMGKLYRMRRKRPI